MNSSRGHDFIRNIGFLIDQIAFPVLIAFFILDKLFYVAPLYPQALENLRRVIAHNNTIVDSIAASRFLAENLVILYNAVSLYALLTRKKPLQKSETIPEIAVPLITIAAYFSLNLLSYIPEALNPVLAPANHLLPMALAGSFFVFSGLAISTIAILQLRHSFAVLVQVREVVSKGFYRYTRHPIYFGYFIQMIGFMLAIPRLWTILWAITSGCLFISRAKLEEKKIAAFSPAYRDYMKQTPFLLPSWKK